MTLMSLFLPAIVSTIAAKKFRSPISCHFTKIGCSLNFIVIMIILRNLEKCPECLQRLMAREIPSKRNFLDFESPDSAISRFPMTLMKSMASLHQGSIYLLFIYF
jgi:hypothetical protein